MTLAQYRELVYRYLHELESVTAGSDMYSTANVDAALNAAQNAWVIRLDHDFFKKQDTVNINLVSTDMGGVTAGAQQQLPADFLSHLQVFYRPSGEGHTHLRSISTELLDAKTSGAWRDDYLNGVTGTPKYFMLQVAYSDGETDTAPWIVFWPPPATPQVNALGLRYTRRPPAMTDPAHISKVMTMFPHLDMDALPSYAMKILLNFEGGTQDDQVRKWDAKWEQCISDARVTLKQLVRNL